MRSEGTKDWKEKCNRERNSQIQEEDKRTLKGQGIIKMMRNKQEKMTVRMKNAGNN